MYAGLPFTGLNTLVYAVVGVTATVGGALLRWLAR